MLSCTLYSARPMSCICNFMSVNLARMLSCLVLKTSLQHKAEQPQPFSRMLSLNTAFSMNILGTLSCNFRRPCKDKKKTSVYYTLTKQNTAGPRAVPLAKRSSFKSADLCMVSVKQHSSGSREIQSFRNSNEAGCNPINLDTEAFTEIQLLALNILAPKKLEIPTTCSSRMPSATIPFLGNACSRSGLRDPTLSDNITIVDSLNRKRGS